jgi:hypothetical protein
MQISAAGTIPGRHLLRAHSFTKYGPGKLASHNRLVVIQPERRPTRSPISVEELDACNLVRDQSHTPPVRIRRLLQPE